jgi:hypothetical protein
MATTSGYIAGSENGVRVLMHYVGGPFGDRVSYYPAAKISLIILTNLVDPASQVSSQEPLIFG